MSYINRIDSLRSVEAAFTLPEVYSLVRQAGLEGAALRRIWPCRFLLTWNRPAVRTKGSEC